MDVDVKGERTGVELDKIEKVEKEIEEVKDEIKQVEDKIEQCMVAYLM